MKGPSVTDRPGAAGVGGRWRAPLRAAPRWALVLVAAAVLAAALVHLGGLDQPLDRDMGAHAAMAQYWMDGLLPYVDVIDNKQPLTYVLFAVPALLGEPSTVVVRLLGVAVNVAALLVLIVGFRRHLAPAGWLVAAVVAAAWGASTWVQGTDLNTEHLLAPFAIAAVALALRRTNRWPTVAAGACVAAAGLIKAPGIVVVAPVAVALWAGRDGWRRLAWGAAGAVLTVAVVTAPWLLSGHVGALWFWNVTYNLGYSADGGPVDVGPLLRLPADLRALEVLLAGGVAVGVVRAIRSRDVVDVVAITWLAVSAAGALIGGRDAPHYFIPVVAPAALILGRATDAAVGALHSGAAPSVARRAGHFLVAVLCLAVLGLGLGNAAAVAAHRGEDRCTLLYRLSCTVWRQHDDAGAWLREHAGPDDELFVVSNEPGFYWAADVLPAAPPLVDFPRQTVEDFDAMVDSALAADPPEWIVFPYRAPQYHPYMTSLEPLDYVEQARFGGVLIHRLQPEAEAATLTDAPG